MAAAFEKNKSKIQAVFEHNLGIVVPRLHSVGLISESDRDQALNLSTDSSIRAADLTSTIESKMVDYHSWWILVYVLLSSGLNADVTFFESLVVSRPDLHLDVAVRCEAHSEPHLTTERSPPLTQGSTSRTEDTASPPHSTPKETKLIGSKDETATDTLESPTAATTKSEASAVHLISAGKYQGIKFSDYCTKQTITFSGGMIKGEGVELQILGRAIERGKSIEFSIQGCIDGPFELPEDVSFASPVYLISPHYQFQREVTLSADIFINLQSIEDCKALIFLTSPTTPAIDEDGLYWKFQVSGNMPQCTRRSRRVRVQVRQFCLFCFGIRRRVPQYQYRVFLYSPLTSSSACRSCHAVFSVTLYHEVFIKNLKEYLNTFHHGFHEICDTPQYLTKDEIELHLPEPINTEGYTITADRRPCIITKSAVDIPSLSWRHKRRAKTDKGGYPPRITLAVAYSESFKNPKVCELKIQGISGRLEAFYMQIPPIQEISGGLEAFNMQIPPMFDYISDEYASYKLKGHPRSLVMPNLINLNIFPGNLKGKIPRMIGNRSEELRDALICHPLPLDLSKDPKENNYYILQTWMTSSGVCTWESLAGALEKIGMTLVEHRALIDGLRLYNGPLTMDTLLNFPLPRTVNLPREVGVRYLSFGTHLLQDATGARICALEHEFNRNCESINFCILHKWLSGGGRPVTWTALVEVLNIIDMGELAKMIADTYVKS